MRVAVSALWLAPMTVAVVTTIAIALPVDAAPPPQRTIGAWTEAVVSVRDPDAASRLFREAGGWTVTARGRIDRSELAYWRLPKAATGSYLRICAPRATTGCIRFVRFDHVAQRPVRLAVRPWDTGGIFSIMVRSDNVQAVFDKAIALGWWAESEPIGFQFKGSDLRNVVLTGPHGVNLALYQRLSPPFTAFPVGAISQGFNSMRMVRDQRASLAFYRDRLGFDTVFDADYLDPAPQPSNFSLPKNLTTSIVRRSAALDPATGEIGRIELMQFVGFDGRDASALASPPNLGILSLRYPVSDLADYAKAIAAKGVVPAYASNKVRIGGLGTIDLVAVRDPDGNITEFYGAQEGAGHD